MTVLYNHTNCCNLQALLVLLLVLPLTRNISNRQSLGSWNLLKSFFHFLNHNNIHHFINSFGDFDDNEKNILKLHSLSSSPTSWYIEQINLLSLMHVMYETIFLFCLVVVVILIKFYIFV